MYIRLFDITERLMNGSKDTHERRILTVPDKINCSKTLNANEAAYFCN